MTRDLLDLRVKLAAADTFGTNLVIALNDYSAKLQAIRAQVEPWVVET
jgi:hypothetical protein